MSGIDFHISDMKPFISLAIDGTVYVDWSIAEEIYENPSKGNSTSAIWAQIILAI